MASEMGPPTISVEEIVREFLIGMKKELNTKRISDVLYAKGLIDYNLKKNIDREANQDVVANELLLDHLIRNGTLETLRRFCEVLEETAQSYLLPGHRAWSNKLKQKLTKYTTCSSDPTPQSSQDELSSTSVELRKSSSMMYSSQGLPSSSSPVTRGESTQTMSTMDERSKMIKEIVAVYRNGEGELHLPSNPVLEDELDDIMVVLRRRLSLADSEVISELHRMVCRKYRRYIHGVRPAPLPPVPDTVDGLCDFIEEKSTIYEIFLVHHAVEVLGDEDLKKDLQEYECKLAERLREILTSCKRRRVTLPLCKDHTHIAVVISQEQFLLALVLHNKEYFSKYLQLEDTLFEGFFQGSEVDIRSFRSLVLGDIHSILLTHKGGMFPLHPFGLVGEECSAELTAPEGVVDEGVEVSVEYAILLSGPFKLPRNWQRVSVVLYLNCPQSNLLFKPISLKLQHWAVPNENSSLCFVKASHVLSPNESEFVFTQVQDNNMCQFDSESGLLSLQDQFCLCGICDKVETTSPDKGDIRCRGMLLEEPLNEGIQRFFLYIMYDAPEWIKAFRKYSTRALVKVNYLHDPQTLVCKGDMSITATVEKTESPHWVVTIPKNMLQYSDLKDNLSSIDRHYKECEDKIALFEEAMYPPSIKFTVTYTKLKSKREPHKQEPNFVSLKSAADYIAFQFSVYSQDSGIQLSTADTKSVQSVISGDTSQQRKRPVIVGDTLQRKRPVISGDTSQQQQTDANTLDSCRKESAPFDQKTFMAKYRDRFMECVPAEDVVSNWEVYNIIDENTYDKVTKAPPSNKRGILFRYIRKNGSLYTIRKMSDFLIETGEHGYPHVKSLGEDMREDLKKYS